MQGNNKQTLIPISDRRLTAIQLWKSEPIKYYANLQTDLPLRMIQADTPTLWQLKNHLGVTSTIAILINAFIHAARLVNVDKNLNNDQIKELTYDILQDYGYLHVEEIKFILKRAIRKKKVFARLDYNVVMNWFEEYDKERTDCAIDLSNQRETQLCCEISDDYKRNAETSKEYRQHLIEQAENGDKQAAEKLKDWDIVMAFTYGAKPPTPPTQSQHEKDVEFQRWKHLHYLKGDKQIKHGDSRNDS